MRLLNTLKKLLKQLKGFIPIALPQGMTEFMSFCDNIIQTYNPAMDDRSVRFVVATLIMRLNPTEAYKAPLYFALALRRGAAGQVSAYAMEQIKHEQAAEQLAAKQSEVTVNSGSSDVQSTQV